MSRDIWPEPERRFPLQDTDGWQVTPYGLYHPGTRPRKSAAIEVFIATVFLVPGPPVAQRYPVPGCACNAPYATDSGAHATSCPARLAVEREADLWYPYTKPCGCGCPSAAAHRALGEMIGREYLPSVHDIPAGTCRQCRGPGPLTRARLCGYCDEAFDPRAPRPAREPAVLALADRAGWLALALLAVIIVLLAIVLAVSL